MARVGLFQKLSNLGVSDFLRYGSSLIESLVSEFNGRIDFVENIRAAGPYQVVFPNSSTVVSVTHNLGRVPQGFLVLYVTGAGVVYKPQGYDFTDKKISLQANTAVTAVILVV